MDSRTFLRQVFGDEFPTGCYLLVWELPGKGSTFFTDPDAAADAIERLAPAHDVYVGVGFRSADLGPRKRGDADSIAGIVGFVADLDIADPVHKQVNLPPDLDAARRILAAMPIAPTILIDSGHGLQAWWVFQEPYVFDSAEDRARVRRISEGWTAQLRGVAGGYAVDSVFDLSRVMRVPGTWNRKREQVPCVALVTDGPLTGGPSDFEPFLAEAGLQRNGTYADRSVDGLVFSADAEPPFSRFTATFDTDPKFRQWWERKRRDLPDQTTSGYDMALAAMGVAYGWDDQEIVNAGIAWRRRHGEDVAKSLRPDYWARTLNKARSGRTVAELLMEGRISEASGTEHAQKLMFLSEELGLTAIGRHITRVIRRGGKREETWLYLQLDDATTINLGQGRTLVRMPDVRAQLLNSGAVLRAMKPERWIAVLGVLATCAEVEIVEEAEGSTQFAEWVSAYIGQRVANDDDRYQVWVLQNRPFERHGHRYIHAPSFRTWIALERGVNLRPAELHVWLRGAGFTAQTIGVRPKGDGATTSRTYWTQQTPVHA